MTERYVKSQTYLARAEHITFDGAQTLSKRSGAFVRGAFPTAVVRGKGCRAWTVDGQEMIDFICGLGALLIGHAHPRVEAAVIAQLKQGHLASLPHVLEADVSERFCAAVGHDMVRWVSSGSEACTGAMRIARAATGREIIVTSDQSYHGWHDVFAASRPIHPGIPEAMCNLIVTFKYNDLEDLQRVLARHPNNVACVIMEPCLHEMPKEGFLEGVKHLAHEAGALFVLDEMILGLRMAFGGGSEYYNVQPDLATFGKSLGGGLPLGCIVGKREYMQHSWFVSGTFSGNPLSLAACNAVLDIYKTEPVVETLWARGEQFQSGFNAMAEAMGMPAVCDGFAVKPRIKFTLGESFHTAVNWPNGGSIPTDTLAMSLFLQETALRGVLWHPAGGNISAAMTKEDIDSALNSMTLSLMIVQKALDSGDWSVLKGLPIQSTPFVRR
jgi:glutamate-1-semialdehyde aminotransferase